MMLCINNDFVNNHVIQCYESYYGKIKFILSTQYGFSFYDTRTGLGCARHIQHHHKMFEGSLSVYFLTYKMNMNECSLCHKKCWAGKLTKNILSVFMTTFRFPLAWCMVQDKAKGMDA